ncbi:MAG: phenylacetate--CoA ligase, partial [Propionibacteriales bacterium]|nr:phenylacetate--CoA ligase [Propionibacteriales bacterium]
MFDLVTPMNLWDAGESLHVDELRSLQLSRLRTTLHRAYAKVPHYRRAFDDAGVHPDDLVEIADLARFPLTSKADLRDNYPFDMFAVPRRDVDMWADVVARSIRAAGGRAGDLVHVAYGYGLFTGGLGAHYGA